MTTFCITLLAIVVLVALFRKNSVKFHARLWGAQVHLEARGDGGIPVRQRVSANGNRFGAPDGPAIHADK